MQTRDPFAENSTRATPTLSEAVAVILTMLLRPTVLPFAGAVIETVGGVVSTGTGVGVGVGVEVGGVVKHAPFKQP